MSGAVPEGAVLAAVEAARVLLRMAADEAVMLRPMATTALALAEAFTGQVLIVRGFEDRVARGPEWRRLAFAPVVAIESVGLEDVAIDIDVDGRGWVKASGEGPVTVRYSAGLAATWEGLPAAVAQGVAMLVAHLFEDRDGKAMPPAAVAALWRPWRRMRLDGGRR